jgi:hypothetical protein
MSTLYPRSLTFQYCAGLLLRQVWVVYRLSGKHCLELLSCLHDPVLYRILYVFVTSCGCLKHAYKTLCKVGEAINWGWYSHDSLIWSLIIQNPCYPASRNVYPMCTVHHKIFVNLVSFCTMNVARLKR